MGRVAHCFKEGGFRFDKVSLGKQCHSKIVIVGGALVVLADFSLKIADVFVNIVVAFFHVFAPRRRKRRLLLYVSVGIGDS